MMNKLKDKILGCMVGGAIGDALGYTVEFMSRNAIVKRFGEKGITRYELNGEGVAEISDDTQMSLYTANGLLIDDIEGAYLEWLQTQDSDTMIENPKCELSKLKGMYSLRAPGNTCLSALRAIARGETPDNYSKGCGGIMRVAPVAIFTATSATPFSRGIDFIETARVAAKAAKITHKHPLGYLPAGILSSLLNILITNSANEEDGGTPTREEFLKNLKSATIALRLVSSCNRFNGIDDVEAFEELSKRTEDAIALALGDVPDVDAIRSLGEGWTGDEAWYIAVFCAVRHFDSFEDAIVAAVNHDGDSDSTGAITGNIMGAIYGYEAIPDYYKDNLEMRDVIEDMATKLLERQKIASSM